MVRFFPHLMRMLLMKGIRAGFTGKRGNLKAWQRQFAVWLGVRLLNKLQHNKPTMGTMLMGPHQSLTSTIGHVRSWAEAYEELIIARRRKAAAN